MKNIKRYIAMLLIVVISTQSIAGTYTNYAIQAAIYDGAQVALTAVKNGVKKGIKVRPSPSMVAKRIGPVAIASGLAALGLAGADYVMDPANNRIQVISVPANAATNDQCAAKMATSACEVYGGFSGSWHKKYNNWGYANCNDGNRPIVDWLDVNGASLCEPPEFLSYNEIASAVIDGAQSGQATAQAIVTDAVREEFSTGAYDYALDSSPAITSTSDGTTDGTTTTSADVDLSPLLGAINNLSTKIDSMSDSITRKLSELSTTMSAKLDYMAQVIGQQTQDILSGQQAQTGEIVDAIDASTTATGQVIGQASQDIVEGQRTQTGEIVNAIDVSTTATGEVIGQASQDIVEGQRTQTGELVNAIDASTTATGEVIGQASQDIIDSIDNINVNTDNTDIVDAVNTNTGSVDAVGQKVDELKDTVTDTTQAQTDEITGAISEQTEAVNEKIDEFTEELPQENTDLDIPQPPLPTTNTQINFGGQCPMDKIISFDYHGNPIEWVVMPWSKMCNILASYIAPVLKLLGAIFAVVIVGRT